MSNHLSGERSAGQFAQNFDREWGGFAPPPKFPTPHNLVFLLRCAQPVDNIAELEGLLEL